MAIKIPVSDITAKFQGLTLENVGTWPLLPRATLWAALVLVCALVGYFALWSGQLAQLDQLRQQEVSLKEQYRYKLAQAINLDDLRRQKEQVGQYVLMLEKQLPSKAEMDALLSDINQAGIGRGLQFELFRPGRVVVRDYYAELPIAIRLSGRYDDLGAFATDIADLPRIVTLNDIKLRTNKDMTLTLDATAKTYRYLDEEELAARRHARMKGRRK